MRPRTLGKIVLGVLTVMCLLTAFYYALDSPDVADLYRSMRGITYSVMALVFATLYRYVED